jgi:hypothetical protein
VKNGLRVRRGEGRKGRERGRDRKGRLAREEKFEQLHAVRKTEWARRDAPARLHWKAIDRMLRVDDDKVDCDDKEEGKLSKIPHPRGIFVLPYCNYMLEYRPILPYRPLPPSTITTMKTRRAQSHGLPPDLSPASRRPIYKRLYMRRMYTEASGEQCAA